MTRDKKLDHLDHLEKNTGKITTFDPKNPQMIKFPNYDHLVIIW